MGWIKVMAKDLVLFVSVPACYRASLKFISVRLYYCQLRVQSPAVLVCAVVMLGVIALWLAFINDNYNSSFVSTPCLERCPPRVSMCEQLSLLPLCELFTTVLISYVWGSDRSLFQMPRPRPFSFKVLFTDCNYLISILDRVIVTFDLFIKTASHDTCCVQYCHFVVISVDGSYCLSQHNWSLTSTWCHKSLWTTCIPNWNLLLYFVPAL